MGLVALETFRPPQITHKDCHRTVSEGLSRKYVPEEVGLVKTLDGRFETVA